MASSTISGIFPIQSNATTNGSQTTFVLSIAGDGYNDNQNICDVVLSIYSLSSMKDKAQEDTVAYISGSLLIINKGPDAIDGPHMVIDAFTLHSLWKTLGFVPMIWNLQMLTWPQQISLVKSLQLQMDLLENLVSMLEVIT